MQETMSKRTRQKGAALVYIIVIFAFVASATTVIYELFNHNFRQAYHQQKQQQAYYIALSGIELATTALLKVELTSAERWYDDFNDPTKINTGYTSVEGPIDVGEGKVTVEIQKIKIGNEDWIKIQSVGKVTDMQDKEVKVTAQLLISTLNEELIDWKVNYGG